VYQVGNNKKLKSPVDYIYVYVYVDNNSNNLI